MLALGLALSSASAALAAALAAPSAALLAGPPSTLLAAAPARSAKLTLPPSPKAVLSAAATREASVTAEIVQMVFHDRSRLNAAIDKALRGYLQDPARVRISLVPEEPAKLLAGCFKDILVQADDTECKGMLVKHAYLRLRDCRIDLRELVKNERYRVLDAGKADLLVSIGEKDINDLFRKKNKKKVRNPHLDLRPGHLKFSCGIRSALYSGHVKLAGTVSIKDGTKVYFNPRWMNLDFLPIPDFIVRAIARKMNPVADFDRLVFMVPLSVVEITDDTLYVGTESMRHEVLRLVSEEAAARPTGPATVEGDDGASVGDDDVPEEMETAAATATGDEDPE